MISDHTIELAYLKMKWTWGWWWKRIRLSHARMRHPTRSGDIWLPTFTWDLPQEGLTVEEARACMARCHDEAKRRYQQERQRMAERRQWQASREHSEPGCKIEVEHYGGAAHSRIIN